jgi:hypothetical protein
VKTIGGHERGVVVMALRLIAMAPDEQYYFDCVLRCTGTTTGMRVAFAGVSDPAKLAELLAEALMERGVDVGGAPPADRRPYNVFHGADLVGIVDWSRSNKATYSSAFASGAATMWDMPQARAALLRVLSLPEGATAEDARKAVAEWVQ